MIGAVDIGGTKVAVGLVDRQGRIVAQEAAPTAALLRYRPAVAALATMLQGLLSRVGCGLEGVGIGLTGRLDGASGRVGRNDVLPDWQGQDLAADLGQAVGAPVAIENDADAAALGEAAWGAGRGMARFIYVTVSTGIGGGIVLEGRLYRGIEGSHPEMGHHVIDPQGPACYCGARGCWERLASGTALAEWAQQQLGSRADLGQLDARRVCALAVEGLPEAQRAVEREGHYLGLGLANLMMIFAPDRIALGGGVMKSWPLFEEAARRVIAQNCGLVPYQRISIVPAQLGAHTGLIGAAQVWLHACQ